MSDKCLLLGKVEGNVLNVAISGLASLLDIPDKVASQVVHSAPIILFDGLNDSQAAAVRRSFSMMTDKGVTLAVEDTAARGERKVSWPAKVYIRGRSLEDYAFAALDGGFLVSGFTSPFSGEQFAIFSAESQDGVAAIAPPAPPVPSAATENSGPNNAEIASALQAMMSKIEGLESKIDGLQATAMALASQAVAPPVAAAPVEVEVPEVDEVEEAEVEVPEIEAITEIEEIEEVQEVEPVEDIEPVIEEIEEEIVIDEIDDVESVEEVIEVEAVEEIQEIEEIEEIEEFDEPVIEEVVEEVEQEVVEEVVEEVIEEVEAHEPEPVIEEAEPEVVDLDDSFEVEVEEVEEISLDDMPDVGVSIEAEEEVSYEETAEAPVVISNDDGFSFDDSEIVDTEPLDEDDEEEPVGEEFNMDNDLTKETLAPPEEAKTFVGGDGEFSVRLRGIKNKASREKASAAIQKLMSFDEDQALKVLKKVVITVVKDVDEDQANEIADAFEAEGIKAVVQEKKKK